MAEMKRATDAAAAAKERKREEDAAAAAETRLVRDEKKRKKLNDLSTKGKEALVKLRSKSCDADKLTKTEMQSIAVRYFGEELKGNSFSAERITDEAAVTHRGRQRG